MKINMLVRENTIRKQGVKQYVIQLDFNALKASFC